MVTSLGCGEGKYERRVKLSLWSLVQDRCSTNGNLGLSPLPPPQIKVTKTYGQCFNTLSMPFL